MADNTGWYHRSAFPDANEVFTPDKEGETLDIEAPLPSAEGRARI